MFHSITVLVSFSGNPYPPVVYKHRNNDNLLSNVLLRAVRENYKNGQFSAAQDYQSKKHLDEIDMAVNQFQGDKKPERTEMEQKDKKDLT